MIVVDKHHHVVDYMATERDSSFFYIVMELCDHDLAHAVAHGLLPDNTVACHQLLQAVAHLHELNLVHRGIHRIYS